ncbi:hypothetical protein QR98_0098550, partial [Sarcoptes scabiei]
ETQHSSYEEQPDLLRQDIVKPVVQDVHETIVPFRRITQELKPVQETIHQILPRGEQRGFFQRQQVAQVAQVAQTPAVATFAAARPAAVAVQAVQAAPAAVAVQAAPAAVAVQAAPAVAVQAAPALAVQAAPAYSISAAPAVATVGLRPAGLALGYGTTGLYGGSYGSSYSLQPAHSSYTTFSSSAYPIRKKK